MAQRAARKTMKRLFTGTDMDTGMGTDVGTGTDTGAGSRVTAGLILSPTSDFQHRFSSERPRRAGRILAELPWDAGRVPRAFLRSRFFWSAAA